MAAEFKSYKDISKAAKWGTDEAADQKTWESIQKGLLIRQTEAMELMASGYQHLLDEVERYKRGYQDMKNRKETLENETRQLKSVVSRFRNERDRLKDQMQENASAL